MAVDYDRAFAEVIVPRWRETPIEQRNAAEFPKRRGQLAPDAPDSHALFDSFRLEGMLKEADVLKKQHPINVQVRRQQAIINEYLPGQGIAPHIDRDCFGPIVATVSLGSAINMDFRCDSTGDEYVQRLVPRSLVLLHGDARFKWRHGIAKRHSDTWNGQKTKRQRRVSITFRTIADTGPAQT